MRAVPCCKKKKIKNAETGGRLNTQKTNMQYNGGMISLFADFFLFSWALEMNEMNKRKRSNKNRGLETSVDSEASN